MISQRGNPADRLQLWKGSDPYTPLFGVENDDIGLGNTYFCVVNNE